MARPKYEPTDSDYKKAFEAKTAGKSDKKVAETLGIAFSTYNRHKEKFEKYFRLRRAPVEKKQGPGRPRTSHGFTPKVREQIIKILSLGATDKQCADIMGIHKTTLYDWRKRYPDFDQECRSAKDVSDFKVVEKLFEATMGYRYNEKVTTEYQDKKGATINKQVTSHDRFSVPSITAMRVWLANRANWKYGSEQAQSDPETNKGKILEVLESLASEKEEK
jgi:transposase